MRLQARIVFRESSDANDGLGLAFLFKGQTEFKKGVVYELYSFDGEVIMKEVGPSCVPVDMLKRQPMQLQNCSWANGLGDLVMVSEKYLCLTQTEYDALCVKG